MKENIEKLENILYKYNLDIHDKNEFLSIIKPIFLHAEFQKRMSDPFFHHGKISLGEHILEDSIVTYVLAKRENKKLTSKINISLAVKIAMLHDLYTEPWQNNLKAKKKHLVNKHGFRHPIEAVINAYIWYPDIFNNFENSTIIIDGILHHMFPFPVVSRKSFVDNMYQLNNYDYFAYLPNEIKKIIIDSLKRHKLGSISFSRSLYQEGRIMAKADRQVSFHQIKNINNSLALITGHNKNLNK